MTSFIERLKVFSRNQVIVASWALAIGLAICSIVRVTCKDANFYLAYFFYIAPVPILVVGWLILALSLRWHCHSRLALGALIMALGWGMAVPSNLIREADESELGRISVMSWNPWRGKVGWERVIKTVRDLNPDIAGFVEAGHSDGPGVKLWKERFPEYDSTPLDGGVILLVKGKINKMIARGGNRWFRHLVAEVTVQGIDINVIVVDIFHSPFQGRRGSFARLRKHIDSLDGKPLLILGDFNTPIDSECLGPLREIGLKEAFEEVGNGWHATWPSTFPVHALDQLWMSSNAGLRTSWIERVWASDHQPVMATIEPTR